MHKAGLTVAQLQLVSIFVSPSGRDSKVWCRRTVKLVFYYCTRSISLFQGFGVEVEEEKAVLLLRVAGCVLRVEALS